MLKMYDFLCDCCGHQFEHLAREDSQIECPECRESPASRRVSGGHSFVVIKATTNTSKRYKAGYVHQFNRPKEKISVSVPVTPAKP